MKAYNEWWRGAVFYQIYPRSFLDTNGDGIGDLKGIAEKLDYVAGLGVDGVWISPFLKSPMKDFGYDISDYRAVDPVFGTLEEFDKLLKKAHKLGLKIIMDLVLNHTSDQHPWFIESRKDKTNPKADWYIWADPKPDGMPPNNWRSLFGGPAWSFDNRREQYYMHNFIRAQPDLNYHNPEVQKAMLDECRFWLERGIDGLRLDVINFLFHDRQLRDNPPKDPHKEGYSHQYEKREPYNMQRHLYDKSQPENLEFIQRLRKLTDEYPDIFTLGEIGDDKFLERASEYTRGHEHLNTAYNFALIYGKKASAKHIRSAIEEFESFPGHGWPSWTFSNHDNIRVVTRWSQDVTKENYPAFAKVLIALLASLRGSIFFYQGEELGLTEAEIPYEKIQDPWGMNTWPDWQGRDGCRTPMPWNHHEPNAEFTSVGAEPWLPIPNDHLQKAVSLQDSDSSSVLNFTRNFLKWRKSRPELITGEIRFIETGDTTDKLLAFTRRIDSKTLLCAFNLGANEASIKFEQFKLSATGPETKATAVWYSDKKTLSLKPYGWFFAEISC